MTTKITKAEKEAEKKHAIEKLLERLPESIEIMGVITHVSSSGNSRCITFLIANEGRVECIDYYIAKALDMKISKSCKGLIVTGSGMNMVFAVVNILERVLSRKFNYAYL
jgi:Tfp pilus assembly protein PilO